MLPDILAPDLDIVFCGTAAGRRSAALGHYYAGRGNRFWNLLHQTGLTPRCLRPDEDSTLPAFGLGLTDLAKGVAGMDRDIPLQAYVVARLPVLLAEWKPRALAFTSLAAARIALRDAAIKPGHLASRGDLGAVELFALSSPSGANGHFSPDSWRELAAWRAGTGRR